MQPPTRLVRPRSFTTAVCVVCLQVALASSALAATPNRRSTQPVTRTSAVSEPARQFVFAANGQAFRLEEGADDVRAVPIETSRPAFKAYGFAQDGRTLLYRPLVDGIPSGELLVEESGAISRPVSRHLVMDAAWSPTDDAVVAFTFATGEGFGIGVADLRTGSTRTLAEGDVVPDFVRWSDAGDGLYYFVSTGKELEESARLEARFAPITPGASRKAVPAGVPVLDPEALDRFSKRAGPSQPGNTGSPFRVAAPGGTHEVLGEVLFGDGQLVAVARSTGQAVPLGAGQLLRVLDSGAVVRSFTEAGPVVRFVSWNGKSRTVNTTAPVDYRLPMQSSMMIRGGSLYGPNTGQCGNPHNGILGYAYDLWAPNRAPVLASASGLVVKVVSSVTCNTLLQGCADYDPNRCQPSTFLGNQVIIEHADGTFTLYAHLEYNAAQVSVGQTVCQGAYIVRQGHTGSAGNSGRTPCGDHLHFSRNLVADGENGQSTALTLADAPNPLQCSTTYTTGITPLYTLSATSANIGCAGDTGSVDVIGAGSCGDWTAESLASWVTISAPTSGTGNGTVAYTVAPNTTGAARTATLVIGGQVFTITQTYAAPLISCPANVTAQAQPGNCSAVVSYAAPTVTPGCNGTATVTCAPPSGASFSVGVTPVTCTATDSANNSASCSFNVTVVDSQAASITQPAAVLTKATSNAGSTVTYTSPTATSSCGAPIGVSCSPPSGSTFPIGVTTVTCTAGGSSTASFTVTVDLLTNGGFESGTAGWTQKSAGYINNNPSPPAHAGSWKAQFLGTGVSNNHYIYQGPFWPTPAADRTLRFYLRIITAETGTTANDTFGVRMFTSSNVYITDLANFSNLHAATYADYKLVTVTIPASLAGSGNRIRFGGTENGSLATAFLVDDVTLVGQPPPSITCPVNISQPADSGQCSAVVAYPAPSASDGLGSPLTPVCIPAAGSTFPVGTTTVTCTATDGVGQSATCTFQVTVTDAQQPSLTCPSDMTVAAPSGQCSAIVDFATPTAIDECGSATVSCVPATGSTFPVGTTTVTCTATDSAGNTNDCTFSVTVTGSGGGVSVSCPADVSVQAPPAACAAVVNFAVPNADGCGGPATVVCVPAPGSTFPVGTSAVTCTATDSSNNTASCSFDVTVTDATGPSLSCPSDMTISADAGQCTATASYTVPTASDSCSAATVTCSPASGSTFPIGATTVTCTATDAAGNASQCAFTVTVQDGTAPAIGCPADVTAVASANACSANVTFATPHSTDDCGTATVSCVPASGSAFPVGTTTVTCTATDAGGNFAQCTFSVTVNDTTAPTIACPAGVTVPAASGQCTATVSFATPTVSDNCAGATVTCSPASGSTFPIGVTTVSCTATDAAGNSASCSFDVTVTDATGPAIACPATLVVPTATGACSAVVTYPIPGAVDACSAVASVTCLPAPGSTFPLGVTTVTCTALDTANNASACSFAVSVVDQQAPSIACPANVTRTATSSAGAVATFTTPAATDACGGSVSVVCAPASGTTFPIGVSTVTCTATDAASNSAACSFTVTVDLLSNGGFESGVSSWTQKVSGLINSSATNPPRTGSWKAQMLGTGVATNHFIYQSLPAASGGVTRTLRFYLKIVSSEGTTTPNDFLGVRITNSSNTELIFLQQFSNVDQVTYADYQLVTITIPAQYCVGGNRIRFGANENASVPTTFFIDDVSIY